jgi:Tfp pilus assembly protein PilF
MVAPGSDTDERQDSAPMSPDSHATVRRAAALLAEGKSVEAEEAFAAALVGDPNNSDAHFGRAICLEALGRKNDAETAYRRACECRADFCEARNNLGALLLARGRPSEALPNIDEALRLNPAFLPARFNRAMTYLSLGRLREAESELRALLEARPGDASLLNELGRVLMKQSRSVEAVGIFRQGRERYPRDARFAVNLSRALEVSNDLEGAERAAREALKIEPSSSPLQYALACLEVRQGKLPEARRRLESLLRMESLGSEERSDALMELGLVLDRLGETAAAFAAITKGKALRRSLPAIERADGDRFLARVRAAREWFTRDRVRKISEDNEIDDKKRPVFFVGFPRSGTTLMEQALKAHPDVLTTDERSPLEAPLRSLDGDGGYPASLESLTPDGRRGLRAMFFEEAARLFGPLEGRVLVDKMPLNIVHLGLVACLFPGARVLVALRDPRDVCLSCYMQRFTPNDAMVNFLDLGQTAETYAAVMDLWLHYRQVLDLNCLEYRYEDLVSDFEGVLRSVVGFIGLEWRDDVTAFREKTARQAAPTTPSYRQVVRDTYQSSAGRWRRYRGELEPVLELLNPFVDAFGYGATGARGRPASATSEK